MFQFPANPLVGQVFSPLPGVSYKWNGTGWAPFSTTSITRAEVEAMLLAYIPLTQKGVAGGVATLDADGLIPPTQDSPEDAIAMAIALG